MSIIYAYVFGAVFCVATFLCAIYAACRIADRRHRAELAIVRDLLDKCLAATERQMRDARMRTVDLEHALQTSRRRESAATDELHRLRATGWKDTSPDFIYSADGSSRRQ